MSRKIKESNNIQSPGKFQMEEPSDAMDGPTNGYNAYKTRNMIASVICLEYMALSKDD